MLNITVTNRNTGNKKEYKFTQNAILIGRQKNCDIILESAAVSRRHAKITVNKNLIEIEDLGSGNGTIVNQTTIRGKEKILIQPEDKIRIEEFEIKIDQPDVEKEESPKLSPEKYEEVTDPEIIEIKMIKKVLGALDQDKLAHIIVISDDFKGQHATFEEDMDELVIGREANCHLSLNSPVISRRHATISMKWGGFVVTDLGSKNGTFVNGEKVEEKAIKDGDEVVFGTIKTIFKNPQEFDISVISKTFTKEKDKKFEKTDSFERGALHTEEKISKAAKISAGTEAKSEQEKPKKTKEDEKPKETKIPKEKPPEILDDLLEEEAGLSRKTTKHPQKSKAKRLSVSELILFGFGGLVILLVIGVLILLFAP